MRQRHHIRRQRIELIAPGVTTQTVARRHAELAELQERVILPALQRAFDGVTTDGREVAIAHLGLELTVDTASSLADQVAAQLPSALARALARAKIEATGEAPGRSFFAAVVRWLQTGNPGWGGGALADFAERLSVWLEGEEEFWLQQLLRLVVTHEGAFLRARSQVQGKLMGKLVYYLETVTPSESAAPEGRQLPANRAELWRRICAAGLLVDIRIEPPGVKVEEAATSKTHRDTGAKQTLNNVAVAGAGAPTGGSVSGGAAAAGDGYFLSNAGLVVLHPYLRYLLEQTGALAEDGSPDPGRAARMLHYAVFGESAAPPEEWDLPLTKLLLGLEPEQLLLPDKELSSSDREAVDELLRGVIGHWSVLKSTSPAGLRGGFLQRNGKLAAGPGGYVLTVEQATQDILLNSLPWSIGIVKTPWMGEPLQVVWS